jgi:hypothetical protein
MTVVGRARGVPLGWTHAPSSVKPNKKASEQEWAEYRIRQQSMKVSSVGARRLSELRSRLDKDHQEHGRRIIVSVDGGFTNRAVFRNLPHDTMAIGRIRKDARLFLPLLRASGPVGDVAVGTENLCQHLNRSVRMCRSLGAPYRLLQPGRLIHSKSRPLCPYPLARHRRTGCPSGRDSPLGLPSPKRFSSSLSESGLSALH